MNWSCVLLQVLENVTFRPLTRWFKAAVPSDVRIGVERAKKLQFSSFPKRPVERSRWIAAVRCEGWQPNQHSRICSAHLYRSCHCLQHIYLSRRDVETHLHPKMRSLLCWWSYDSTWCLKTSATDLTSPRAVYLDVSHMDRCDVRKAEVSHCLANKRCSAP